MSTTRRSSMKRKLMLINTVTSVATLLFASLCFTLIAVFGVRSAVRKDVTGLAGIYSQLCQDPARRGDKDALTEILQSIGERPHVVYASITDLQGRPLATPYRKPGIRVEEPFLQQDELKWTGTRLLTARRTVISDGQPIAVVYVQRSMRDVTDDLLYYGGFVLLIVVGSSLLALYLSSRFQRLISVPILLLARTAEKVSRTRNFSLRVKRKTADEIGDLIDCFNDMMGGIEKREAELKRLNEELRVSQERAMASNQAKSDFLARMSHELRTPLNAIIGYSEMLQEEATDAGVTEFVPDLQRVNAAGKHLLMLINDVLDLSKIEAGKMTLFPEVFDVRTMLEDVTSTIQPLIQKNRNTLDVRCGEDLGEINADLTKVRQALFNMLSNSAKFTQEGVITLDARREVFDSPDGATDGSPDGTGVDGLTGAGASVSEQIVFSVSDTGIGMSHKQLEHLFQPFTQADTSTTRKFGGTGLGLTITRRFCEMMGGRITVESEPGRGSTFTMTIPAESPAPAPSEPEQDPAHGEIDLTAPGSKASRPHGTQPTALVIDDDEAARDLLARALEREGYQAVTAIDGAAGLAAARERHPDVITLDVLMPRMDGWTVLSALKNDPELADLPVIMVTVDGNRDLGYALGAEDYLTKPVDRERLARVLRRFQTSPATDRVLIVDDDLVSRAIARRALENEGYSVVEAANGRAALDALNRERPALILLDLLMPVMDGFTFLSTLKDRAEWRSIPVIVVTAKDLTSHDHRLLNGFVRRTLRKGAFSREELLAEVRHFATVCAERDRAPAGTPAPDRVAAGVSRKEE